MTLFFCISKTSDIDLAITNTRQISRRKFTCYILIYDVALTSHASLFELHEPWIFYPSGHWPEIVTNAHVSAHFRYSLGASVIPTHLRTEGLYVKATLIYQLKRLCFPDCAYTENMFINSIRISLYDTSLTQKILSQLKEMWLYERY